MKKISNKTLLIGCLVIVVIVGVYFINQNYQKNKCYNLDMNKENFLDSLDKCYISGVINKEKKEYLTEKFKQKIKNTISIEYNKSIDINNVRITPGAQYVLSFNSNYCNNRDDYCNGCSLNFYNNNSEGSRNIIFSHEFQNSGMNFIDKSNFNLLASDFCFNLDCGEGKSQGFCVNKTDIK